MSAIGDLRDSSAPLGDVLLREAVLELDDRLASIERAIFPPAAQPTDPAAIAAQPITVAKPELSGSIDAPVEA